MSALRQHFIHYMQLRRFTERTRESYVHVVAELAKYYGRSPDQIGEAEVLEYLRVLRHERQLSYSTCNVAACALKCFYQGVLKASGFHLKVPRFKSTRRLPEVLSKPEVQRLLLCNSNLKHRSFLMTVYSAGLRVNEATHLRAHDIDSQRMLIRVDQGKGSKDRYTVLAQKTLIELREYWKHYRPEQWLFEGRTSGHPLPVGTAQKIYYQTKRRAGITKFGGIHTLRHCFATHLLEDGVELVVIQRLLGHRHWRTTARSLHLSPDYLKTVVSPLDELYVSSRKEGK